MEKNNIHLTPQAIRAISMLQGKQGTYEYYDEAVEKMYYYTLRHGDEIGMSDGEALDILRTLDALRQDLAAIAGHDTRKFAEVSDDDLKRLVVMLDDEDEDEDDDLPDETETDNPENDNQ